VVFDLHGHRQDKGTKVACEDQKDD
jgi:hypothetical protein